MQLREDTARPSKWVSLAVNAGVAIAGVQTLFVLLVIIQGLALREAADNFPSDLLHRIGIAFSTGVNIPSGLSLLVATFLVTTPALVAGDIRHQRGLRTATLVVIEVVAAVIAVGTILGVRASLHAARLQNQKVSPYQRWELAAYLAGTLGTALVVFLVALAAMPSRRDRVRATPPPPQVPPQVPPPPPTPAAPPPAAGTRPDTEEPHS